MTAHQQDGVGFRNPLVAETEPRDTAPASSESAVDRLAALSIADGIDLPTFVAFVEDLKPLYVDRYP